MKILHITTFLQGGAGKVIIDLAKASLNQGHSVSVACTKESVGGYGNYPEHLETLNQNQIPIIFLDSSFSRDSEKKRKASKTIRSNIIKEFPNLIHSHSSSPSFIGLEVNSKLKKNIPIIQTMHGWGIFKTEEQEHQDIEILNRVNHVVSISKASEHLLVQKGLSNPNKSVIYNGVETSPNNLENPKDNNLLKLKSLKKEGKKIIGVIGTVDARKNQLLVLEALSILPTNLQFHTVFIGEGTDLIEYREKAKTLGLASKVTFTGYKPAARSFIKELDLLVSASLSEGAAPIVILEAFSEKTLVLASDTPENKEAINSGQNGLLFRSGNNKDLCKKIVYALNCSNSDLMIASAYKKYLLHYSLESTIKNYQLLYGRILK